MNELVKVIIDRRRWWRGQTSKESELQKDGGQRCCLGFACLALGLNEDQILRCCYPAKTFHELKGLTELQWGIIRNTEFSKEAAIVNDDATITDKVREAKLKEMAFEAGFVFEFVN